MNIFFVLCDELRADALGCMGNKQIKTPHIDSLASDSVLFEKSICNTPMCVPSRVSLATGRHALSHAAVDNMLQPRPTETSLFSLLQAQGYQTFSHGKWHCNIEPERFGMDSSNTGTSNLSPPESYISCFGIEDKSTREKSQYKRNDGEISLIISGKRPSHKDKTLDSIVLENYLDDLAIRKQAQEPMFAQLSIMDPHTPYLPAEPFASMYEPGDIDMPSSLSDPLDSKPRLQRYFYHARGFDKLDEQDYRKTKAAYYGSVSHVDERVGKLISNLKKQGLYDDSLIVFTSDHGSMMGEHGFVEKWGHMYEPVINTPLLIKMPFGEGAGTRKNGLVESIDIMPTILDLLGLESSSTVHGKSLLPYIRKQSTQHKSLVFAQYYCQGLQDEPAIMVKDETWKLTSYPCGKQLESKLFVDHYLRMSPLFDGAEVLGELYHLVDDPDERNNLFDVPEYSHIKRHYLDEITKWKSSFSDLVHFPKIDKPRLGGSYSLLQGDNLDRLEQQVTGDNKQSRLW
ncbi:DUF229 domain-containing protein [Alginatibacterium sediminis]|uniref:DUF229 domain-containing protein n=1 Tax=Alginatibacterium sediminis TaxID=2164068 RepID=A0A420EB95_9ALTE|nr:sulfatase-like hydrolase/transferase [Alginatibacterium sediminis]RKF17923.1 DUF229 domain-containing protein [Alginatibacterium sediminis]